MLGFPQNSQWNKTLFMSFVSVYDYKESYQKFNATRVHQLEHDV